MVETEASEVSAHATPPYPFDSGAELLAQCREHGLELYELMLANERTWRSEDEIRSAVRDLVVHAHLVSEPSGAVGLAAYRQGATPPGHTVMVLSGGNIEPSLLAEILAG